jgi:hypothetical protein
LLLFIWRPYSLPLGSFMARLSLLAMEVWVV